MTVYGWRCKGCGATADSTSRTTPPFCCEPMIRDYRSVTMGPGAFQPHFNHSIGMQVNSMRDFTDGLKQRSEENSIRTGTTHEYSPIMPGDMPAPTKDTDILETRNRIVHDTHRTDMKVVN